MDKFYIGLHQPSDARHFAHAFISVNRLMGPKGRKSDFGCSDWILDSGAFTEIFTHGRYRMPVAAYAEIVNAWAPRGMTAAVAQDYMCEPVILAKTGLTIPDHQRLTIERYDDLAQLCPDVLIIPVLQGYAPADYVAHIRQYGSRLHRDMWVGVGSICKRNGTPAAVLEVLVAIHVERPDLRLHGFGLKKTALAVQAIRDHLHSADSLAWSFNARRNGQGRNDRNVAAAYVAAIESLAS